MNKVNLYLYNSVGIHVRHRYSKYEGYYFPLRIFIKASQNLTFNAPMYLNIPLFFVKYAIITSVMNDKVE